MRQSAHAVMPELRRDPIIGRWVIIAVERARRPKGVRPATPPVEEQECPFCEGKEGMTSPEIHAIRKEGTAPNTPGWQTRVVPSRTPFLKIEGKITHRGKGLYDVINGIGAHEVIIESPAHVANMADLDEIQIAKTLSTWIERFVDLEGDKRFKYVQIFKNYGSASGGGHIRHTRTQLIATPITPKRIKEELRGAKRYFDYHERCVFCDIIRQEMEEQVRIIADIDGFVALAPYASRFPFETWILPKEHNCDFSRMSVEGRMRLARIIKNVLGRLKEGLEDPPYNVVLHTAPFRRPQAKAGYWKTIDEDYHWHLEIFPRLTPSAGFEWGTGFYICPITPEEAAKYLREVTLP
ncbi:MAG: galactose-1-phosphate uridylyltransferase [Deltaproteobacteria bacterium]